MGSWILSAGITLGSRIAKRVEDRVKPWMTSANSTIYGWLMLAGIGVSLLFWARLARRDDRLILVYIGGLMGAFLGAKLVYLAAEGWIHWGHGDRWMKWATGKSITGALLGGYAGVEIAKRFIGYTGVTGDWFALIVPIGIMLGRIGCLFQGCCLGRICPEDWYTIHDAAGVARWPAVLVELGFNALVLVVLWVLRRKVVLPTQLFHLYLIAYGLFRFGHELFRDTPEVMGGWTGYQFAALALVLLGGWRFVIRQLGPKSSRDLAK